MKRVFNQKSISIRIRKTMTVSHAIGKHVISRFFSRIPSEMDCHLVPLWKSDC